MGENTPTLFDWNGWASSAVIELSSVAIEVLLIVGLLEVMRRRARWRQLGPLRQFLAESIGADLGVFAKRLADIADKKGSKNLESSIRGIDESTTALLDRIANAATVLADRQLELLNMIIRHLQFFLLVAPNLLTDELKSPAERSEEIRRWSKDASLRVQTLKDRLVMESMAGQLGAVGNRAAAKMARDFVPMPPE